MRFRSLPIRKFVRFPWRDRWLVLEAGAWLALTRLAILLVPFRRIARTLGKVMAESSHDDPRDDDLVRRVGWAVRIASRYTPWQTRCLAEGMAAKGMLRLRGLASTLYLGLAKNEEGELEAHAWLRCGSQVVTGEHEAERYAVVARFAEEA
jgi:hypothetical protein